MDNVNNTFSLPCQKARQELQTTREAERSALIGYREVLAEGAEVNLFSRRLRHLLEARRARTRAEKRLAAECDASEQISLKLHAGPTLTTEAFVDPAQQKRVEDILARVPPEDLVGLQAIRLQGPSRQSTEADGSPSFARARYERDSATIQLCYPPEPRLLCVLIGRHAFNSRLSDRQRSEWATFWRSNRGAMPNEAARIDEMTGFAQSYASLRLNRDLTPITERQIAELVGPNLKPTV